MFKPLYNPSVLTCTITIGDWAPCEGIQKLIGFSRGWHHWNSIRLGYNRDSWSSPIRLFMYAYVGGKLIDPKQNILCEVMPKDEIIAELKWRNMFAQAMVYEKHIREYNGNGLLGGSSLRVGKTLPIGYQLNSYAEQDYTGVKLPLEVDMRDLVVK